MRVRPVARLWPDWPGRSRLMITAELRERPVDLGLLGWSGRRESNPHDQLGRSGVLRTGLSWWAYLGLPGRTCP
jgi:hypothetical protein